MASITIRNLDDKVKTRLRILAADTDAPMEEEARLILAGAVEQDLLLEKGLGTTLHELFKPLWRRRTEVAASRTDAGPAIVRVVRRCSFSIPISSQR